MRRACFVLPALALVAAVSGCASARIVQVTPEGGVVAIPSNTNSWPQRHRDQAAKLMAERCPNGYDIVHEEEVVIGQTSTTSESVDRVTPAGYKPGQREQTSTSVVTTTSNQTEYRITYRARQPARLESTPTPVQPGPLPAGLPSRPVPLAH
jgi:hypothetical protein